MATTTTTEITAPQLELETQFTQSFRVFAPVSAGSAAMLGLAYVDGASRIQFRTYNPAAPSPQWVCNGSGQVQAATSSLWPSLATGPNTFWLAFIDGDNRINVCSSADQGASWSTPNIAAWPNGQVLKTQSGVGLALV